jgi:hypothetical protein
MTLFGSPSKAAVSFNDGGCRTTEYMKPDTEISIGQGLGQRQPLNEGTITFNTKGGTGKLQCFIVFCLNI